MNSNNSNHPKPNTNTENQENNHRPTITISMQDHVGILTLNRGDIYNRMTAEFWRDFPNCIRQLDADSNCRAIIIQAEGKHFSAGLDLSMSTNFVPNERTPLENLKFKDQILTIQDAFNVLEEVRMPVIAAIDGACIGGAVGLISACDIRYCTQSAFFSIAEINISICCDVGSLQRLPYIISDTHLREWAYTGENMSAQRASDIGLVSHVFTDKEALHAHAFNIATTIASKSPLAVYGSKKIMNYNRDHSIADSLDYTAQWNASMFNTEEVFAAVAAKKSDETPSFNALPPRPASNRPIS